MSSIAEIRKQNHLDQQLFVSGKLMTRRQMVEFLLAEGWKPIATEIDRVKPMSRIAFFRADQWAQDAHEARIKAAGKKTVYSMQRDDRIYDITKIQYEFALSLED